MHFQWPLPLKRAPPTNENLKLSHVTKTAQSILRIILTNQIHRSKYLSASGHQDSGAALKTCELT